MLEGKNDARRARRTEERIERHDVKKRREKREIQQGRNEEKEQERTKKGDEIGVHERRSEKGEEKSSKRREKGNGVWSWRKGEGMFKNRFVLWREQGRESGSGSKGKKEEKSVRKSRMNISGADRKEDSVFLNRKRK